MRFRVWLIVPVSNARTQLDVEAEDGDQAVEIAKTIAAVEHFGGAYASDDYEVEQVARS